MKTFRLFIPDNLHQDLKIFSAMSGVSMNDIVINGLEVYLESNVKINKLKKLQNKKVV